MPVNIAQTNKNAISCYFVVGNCPKCALKEAIKYGFNKNGIQRFQCKACKTTFMATYSRRYINNTANEAIKVLLKEGYGIRSIGRILKISAVTVIRKIRIIAFRIKVPAIKPGQSFETDELYTFVGNKNNPIWIIYAINHVDKKVVAFHVGRRTNKDILLVINSLINSHPQSIYTDKLVNYRSLIPKEIHSTKSRSTNHIERKNLTLRTHLKRLSRKTICFSKSVTILAACLQIYFWG